jgi:nitrous oxide reductase
LKSNKESGSVVTDFILSGKNDIVIANFDKESLNNHISKIFAGQLDRGLEKFLSIDGEPTVELDDFSESTNSVRLRIAQNVIVTLDSNADKLAFVNFVGKKKDEIERYLLSLDHVRDVEVKFSPSWMRVAPASADKIKIIVKSVK